MIDEALTVPFTTVVLGAPVTVISLDLAVDDQIVAVCTRDTITQRVPLVELLFPDPSPCGAEWIEAYRRWSTKRRGP